MLPPYDGPAPGPSKLISARDAVARFVHDGDSIHNIFAWTTLRIHGDVSSSTSTLTDRTRRRVVG